MKPDNELLPAPAHLTFEETTALPCAAGTAVNALMFGPLKMKPGMTVLTMGTGGVSCAAIQVYILFTSQLRILLSLDFLFIHNRFLFNWQFTEYSSSTEPARPRTRLHSNLHLVIRRQIRSVRHVFSFRFPIYLSLHYRKW